MDEIYKTAEEVEAAMTRRRRALRAAVLQHDKAREKRLRAELRELNRLWEEKIAEEAGAAAGTPAAGPGRSGAGPPGLAADPVSALLPAREQVHQVLSLLMVPAAPKLITSVHGAFFSGDLPSARLASLRRDEERSYRASPNARPYYLCPALTADRLAPARALLTVSTWPLERRIIGPYSPRVDFLTAAIKIAEAIEAHRELDTGWGADATAKAERLLHSFAVSIPGALPPAAAAGRGLDPAPVVKAARAELMVHQDTDQHDRRSAAQWARRSLTDLDRLFGTRLAPVGRQVNMNR